MPGRETHISDHYRCVADPLLALGDGSLTVVDPDEDVLQSGETVERQIDQQSGITQCRRSR